ncbi:MULTISPECIES: ectoine/hydroxyectoine ABC transporter permease subunit EhuC [Thioclava]|mgnify:CR=1 FL=1|uniref:Ectoine/hydroxyectoine ABC transporter permease subunit EhuC n=1 Tax=Thioclava electrotropha TaxID=1549850 RepID=A0ABX6Z0D0_9RHOB|nr:MULTISPECIES: ectoine/hydroxyectoine ABC transporter permease subunit EhuC [Thioclava]MAQ37451.1 ectoine/hydroxyectoine ABC transporter permease subunit EhuC [Thioclava sp.]MPQ94167.1 ectoine/hydroxyectoine ABC transporter permease subunit EhuC [Thioclava sp. JE_KL1]OOY08919.1 ectoine/hydroxyectoine ABC transporter permease subunit EhuC [Thioclava sp. F36-7]OOY14873.1 ectoine/hydroxyectoine ABC transporter permease subunit EhuC [Thioclava sp. DLFJ4-1]OOY30300.1 ectoine/hydroxyectoine ABC tr
MSYIEFLKEYGPRFWDGTLVTAGQFFLASALAIVIALVAGLMKLSRNGLIRGIAVVYIEIFRGTSLLVQLYWIFFVLPLFGLTLPKFTAGFVAVGMNLGAYGAELVRGGIQSVPKGQWEAAYALSMSPMRRMWRIILPQAFVNMLPPWGNLLIELLKNTALVALISVSDLMFEAKQINGSTFLSAQTFGTALIIYYVFARFIVTPFMRWLELVMRRKLGRA